MLKKSIILLIVVALIIALGASLRSKSEAIDIAVILKGMSNPYWKTMEAGILEAAKEQNVSVYIQGTQSDNAAEEQLNLCNTMLLRNPKAIIFASVNNINIAPCLKKANELNITLIDIDGGMRQEDTQNLGIDVKFSVASDNYELGKKAAHYLNDTAGKVLVLEGFPGSIQGIKRAEGFKSNINSSLKVIASVPGDWDRLKAADITGSIITQHPNLTAIFAANDLMALGAAEALRAKNISNVKVIGIDGIADAVTAINSGKLTASIAQLPYLAGREAIIKTDSLLQQSTKYKFDQTVPVLTLDKDILSQKKEPLLNYVR